MDRNSTPSPIDEEMLDDDRPLHLPPSSAPKLTPQHVSNGSNNNLELTSTSHSSPGYERRVRSINFTRSETELLHSLVKKYWGVIESKRTDALSWKKKRHAWEIVASHFNAVPSTNARSTEVLRKKWENYKKAIKMKCFQLKSSARDPNGSFLDIDLSCTDSEFLALLDVPLTGLPKKTNKGGDVSVDPLREEENQRETLQMILPHLNSERIKQESNGGSEDESWDDFSITPKKSHSSLHRSASNVDFSKFKRKMTATGTAKRWCPVDERSKSNRLMEIKLRREIEIGDIEHQRRIELAEKEHNLKIEMFEKEHQQRVEIAEKEHLLKLELLNWEIEIRKKKFNSLSERPQEVAINCVNCKNVNS